MVNVKPVTLYDVAEYAGVSYQTVSRVVNQACHVSAKTREKVEAAMAELNYIPNRVAQQLAGKQSLLIGVATSSLALHAPSQIVAAIKSRADQLGASVVVSMVERSGVEACKAAVHNLLAHRVIHQLEAGICWINTWGESPAEMPVGGYKHSGIGRENGVMTLQSYTQVKSIQVEMAKFQSIF